MTVAFSIRKGGSQIQCQRDKIWATTSDGKLENYDRSPRFSILGN